MRSATKGHDTHHHATSWSRMGRGGCFARGGVGGWLALATAAYPNLPYSAHQDGRPAGSADQNRIETDKPAFLGTAYLALYERTGDAR